MLDGHDSAFGGSVILKSAVDALIAYISQEINLGFRNAYGLRCTVRLYTWGVAERRSALPAHPGARPALLAKA